MILDGDVVVLSPHLDDAVLSLGATIASVTDAGARVTVVTVLAGDPDSDRPAGPWDRSAGFRTFGEAARARRAEDARACEIVGATPVWLPFGDMENPRGGTDDDIWGAVEPYLPSGGTVLIPGFPLAHPDHRWLSGLALERLTGRVGLYLEQPYVLRRWWKLWRRSQEPDGTSGHAWATVAPVSGAAARKREALAAYGSQVPLLGRAVIRRIEAYERRRGGETVAAVAAPSLT